MEVAEHITTIEAAMVSGAGSALGGSVELRKELVRFLNASKSLQSMLPPGSDVQCFVTWSQNNFSNESSALELFTLVSALFHDALRSNNEGANITVQALRDVFFIAKQSSSSTRKSSLVRTSTRATTATPSYTIPEWFPFVPTVESSSETAVRSTSISCRLNIMRSMLALETNILAELYASFFKAFWSKAYDSKSKLVGKKIVYSKLTPPFLRVHVVFIHGSNSKLSLAYTNKVLPSKNKIRERNGKVLGAAILDS